MGPADFDIVSYLERHIKAEKSNMEVDWIKGLEVALDYLNSECSTMQNVGVRKIVLLSDLGCPCDEKSYDQVYEMAKQGDFEITFL